MDDRFLEGVEEDWKKGYRPTLDETRELLNQIYRLKQGLSTYADSKHYWKVGMEPHADWISNDRGEYARSILGAKV